MARDHRLDDLAGCRRGGFFETAIPTRIVSNEEFVPPSQTAAQARVHAAAVQLAGRMAPRLGMGRRTFLRTAGGMAASFLAMNSVFGRFFDVLDIEMADAAAFAEKRTRIRVVGRTRPRAHGGLKEGQRDPLRAAHPPGRRLLQRHVRAPS